MLRSRIFEGIHALRLRKCRPDRETIAHYVLKKYGTQFNEIFNELELIVDEELLVKVEYKGSVSYRLPSSFGTTANTKASPLLTKHSKILNSVKTTRYLIEAVNDLLSLNETYSITGIPLGELKAHLEKIAPERFENERSLIAIERELLSKNGNLLKSSRGRIYPKDLPIPADEELQAAGLTITDDEPEVKKGGEKKKRGESASAGGGSRKRKAQAPGDANAAVIAVKSKPEIQDNIQAAVRKTYEGKFFTLVGSDGSEPPSATANDNANSQEEMEEPEEPEEEETEAEARDDQDQDQDEDSEEEKIQESTVDLSEIFDIATPTPVPVHSSPVRGKPKAKTPKKTAATAADTNEAANGNRATATRTSTRTVGTRNQSKR